MSGWRRRPLVRKSVLRAVFVLGLVLLLAPVISVGSLRAGSGSPGLHASAGPPPTAACGGARTSASFNGSLSDDAGGATPPTVSAILVSLSFWVTLNYTPTNGTSTFSCIEQTNSATTDSVGDFSLAAPVPGSGCNKAFCSTFSGPFGPLVFSTPNDQPAGFFLTQSVSGTEAALAYVVALASTRLAPASRVTLSADAPTVVHAFPTAGNGAPSPATVGYAWQLVGTGWTLLNGSGTANVTIEAFDLATPGTLTVWANGTYNGTPLTAPPVTLEIAAESTTLAQASVTPTSIDVGYPVTFTVTGGGAGGYTYGANVSPGLGAPSEVAPCTTTVVAGGLVALTCSLSIAYTQAGSADPSATLSNGYSSASKSFQAVHVASTLGLSVSPAHVIAYTNESVGVSVSSDPASGTAPQGPACLWPGNGRVLCDAGAGPSYPFSIAFGTAGVYEGHATIADASGANQSSPFSATIYDRPVLANLVASTNVLAVGESATLVGSVSGGALPLSFWWNSSSPSGTLFAGTLSADGPLAFTFVPHLSGETTITLYVLDALGTVLPAATRINVTAGPATNLRTSVVGGGSTVAGAPTTISWTSVNPAGEPVPGWAAPVTIVLGPAPGGPSTVPPAWVNVSGASVPAVAGEYPIPATAWASGILRCTVDLGGAGAFLVSLTGGLPPLGGGSGAVELQVGPNASALVLSRPTVVEPGLRANRTLWQIADRFGDPLDGGSIYLDVLESGTWHNVSSPVLGNVSAGTSVWVNYSVPDGVSATVFVLSGSGEALLPPIAIPAPSPAPTLPVAGLLVAVGAALAAASAYGLWSRARRRGRGEPDSSPETTVSEDELRRWAEGRAHVLQRASSEMGQTLDELSEAFVGRPPRPEEMTDWVASLVADGSLRTVLGDDGRSRFLRVAGPDDAPLRVQLDDRALAEALDRRAALEEREGDDVGQS